MTEVFQPSLFESSELKEGNQQAQPVDLSAIPFRFYESGRRYSRAARTQGWKPSAESVSIDTGMAAADAPAADEPLDRPDSWQPPTEEQKERIRALIAATREGLQQKQP